MSERWPDRIERLDYFPEPGAIVWARVDSEDELVRIVAWSLDRTTATDHAPATGPFRWWALVQDVSGQLVTISLEELVPTRDARPFDDTTLPIWWDGETG